MRGLHEYIRKNGAHFTQDLALSVTPGNWDSETVMDKAQSKVYYNVTRSTIGDMVYLVNVLYESPSNKKVSLDSCIKDMLDWVGDYHRTGYPFLIWLGYLFSNEIDFDFSCYI